MIQFFELLSTVVTGFIVLIMLMMATRSILSMLYPEEEIENPIFRFMVNLTEVFITPVRFTFSKLGWFQNTPLDVSFLATFVILSVITLII